MPLSASKNKFLARIQVLALSHLRTVHKHDILGLLLFLLSTPVLSTFTSLVDVSWISKKSLCFSKHCRSGKVPIKQEVACFKTRQRYRTRQKKGKVQCNNPT